MTEQWNLIPCFQGLVAFLIRDRIKAEGKPCYYFPVPELVLSILWSFHSKPVRRSEVGRLQIQFKERTCFILLMICDPLTVKALVLWAVSSLSGKAGVVRNVYEKCYLLTLLTSDLKHVTQPYTGRVWGSWLWGT